MTPRWRTRRELGSFMGTGRARSARGLARFWPRTLWLKNIRLRRKSMEERPLPSLSCRDRNGNQKIETGKEKDVRILLLERCRPRCFAILAAFQLLNQKTRCLDVWCEEFIAVYKGGPGNRPVGSSDRGRYGDFDWNGSPGQRAGARYEEDSNSRRSLAERAHGGVAREPGHRDRRRQDYADRTVQRSYRGRRGHNDRPLERHLAARFDRHAYAPDV